jgi:hypothetical protein
VYRELDNHKKDFSGERQALLNIINSDEFVSDIKVGPDGKTVGFVLHTSIAFNMRVDFQACFSWIAHIKQQIRVPFIEYRWDYKYLSNL